MPYRSNAMTVLGVDEGIVLEVSVCACSVSTFGNVGYGALDKSRRSQLGLKKVQTYDIKLS